MEGGGQFPVRSARSGRAAVPAVSEWHPPSAGIGTVACQLLTPSPRCQDRCRHRPAACPVKVNDDAGCTYLFIAMAPAEPAAGPLPEVRLVRLRVMPCLRQVHHVQPQLRVQARENVMRVDCPELRVTDPGGLLEGGMAISCKVPHAAASRTSRRRYPDELARRAGSCCLMMTAGVCGRLRRQAHGEPVPRSCRLRSRSGHR